MLKVSDYHKHADECRRLAAQSTLSHLREQLLKLAEMWEQLGEQQAQELTRSKPGRKAGTNARL
jgi:hypothetical protein